MTILLLVILLLFSTDSVPAQWVRIDTIHYTALWANGDTLVGAYVVGLYPKVRISTDGGLRWTEAVTNMQGEDRVVVIKKHKGNLYAGLRHDALDTCSICGGVYRSTDGGSTWHLASTGIPLTSNIAALLDYGDSIFAGGSTFQVPPSFYVSTNGGAQWEIIRDTTFNYFSIAAIVSCGERLFFSGGTGLSPSIWYSTNSGRSWLRGDSGLPSRTSAYSLACFGDRLFAGVSDFSSGYGFYATRHDTVRWLPMNAGLVEHGGGNFASTDSVLFLATFGRLYFLSDTRDTIWRGSGSAPVGGPMVVTREYVYVSGLWGTWRRRVSEIVSAVEESSDDVPMTIHLEQNYPNPFNSATRIRFRIEGRQPVSLRVYDVLGREINILVDAVLERGSHERIFDGSDFSSGVYIYRLQTGLSSKSKCMLLLK